MVLVNVEDHNMITPKSHEIKSLFFKEKGVEVVGRGWGQRLAGGPARGGRILKAGWQLHFTLHGGSGGGQASHGRTDGQTDRRTDGGWGLQTVSGEGEEEEEVVEEEEGAPTWAPDTCLLCTGA